MKFQNFTYKAHKELIDGLNTEIELFIQLIKNVMIEMGGRLAVQGKANGYRVA